MFTKLKTLKKFNNEVITIQQLHSIVQNNPQKDIINTLRGLEYKSKEYNNLKLSVSCITPHGTFNNGIKNHNLDTLSGYLFYDIDGIDTLSELNDTIKRLNDTFPIAFLQRSVSMKGFHFLIKVDDTFLVTNDTFIYVYDYVREILVKKGFNIDMSANGLSRKMIISSDENSFLNDKVSLVIDKVSFNDFKMLRNANGRIKKSKTNKAESITTNDTFLLIPIKELLQQIDVQTKYVKEIEGDFIIEDMEFYYIYIPEIIKDGTKHRLYTRIVNALYFINGNISRQQVLSYMFYVNNRANPGMDAKYLFNFITRLCDNIEQNGVRIKPRIKRIHFNENSEFTKKQKQIMGMRVTGKVRNNNTINIIREARTELLCRNEKDTQKAVQQITGLSIATIKRNWNKELNDTKNIIIPEKEEIIIKEEPKEDLPSIEENEFFNDGIEVEFKYKGFETIKIKITTQDKEDFKDALNRLKTMNFEICYSTLELCGLDKYKLDYLYQIWNKRQLTK